jgi:DHA2 family multidrug resistance protein
VALSTIPRHKMADATGLNSLVRQVGGSIGLAVAATMLTRFSSQSRAALIAHVTPTNPAAADRLNALTRGFASHGVASAREMAIRAMDGLVMRQSTLLSYNRVFLVAGVSFMLVLPLLYFLKVPRVPSGAPKPDVHME